MKSWFKKSKPQDYYVHIDIVDSMQVELPHMKSPQYEKFIPDTAPPYSYNCGNDQAVTTIHRNLSNKDLMVSLWKITFSLVWISIKHMWFLTLSWIVASLKRKL
ncbi:Sulfatase [Candida maltosa Xu316]|uniref:Sulfatase n=1 Tax=Candida maltosa (strain Xu316) TaxID=1245528 RepID=M3ITI1_CANMX|nr:Sulfatase [Candida maltosa Xu316]